MTKTPRSDKAAANYGKGRSMGCVSLEFARALEAENERLREALNQIATADHPDYPHFRSGTEVMFSEHLILVARQTLKDLL